jgi:SpoVK/Ycf46/Vps4 family AAA+-type ATPase
LLFGPPGTGKTTIAEELAKALDSRLIVVTPSDFIQRGEAEIELRAKRIFKALEIQTTTVILFDEIDRMILDRDSKLYQTQSDVFQFMTPGMLTKFRDLWKQHGPLFVVATNYAERIDRAAKRSGRIDDQYLVLPPSKRRRLIILKQHLLESAPQLFRRIGPPRFRDLIAPIVRATALFSVPELKSIVDHVIETTSDAGSTARQLCRRLTEAVEDFRPTISIESYAGRFRISEEQEFDFPTVEEPLEEFLLLLYLVVESGRSLTTRELSLVQQVIPRDDIANRIRVVHDHEIRRRLHVALVRWVQE